MSTQNSHSLVIEPQGSGTLEATQILDLITGFDRIFGMRASSFSSGADGRTWTVKHENAEAKQKTIKNMKTEQTNREFFAFAIVYDGNKVVFGYDLSLSMLPARTYSLDIGMKGNCTLDEQVVRSLLTRFGQKNIQASSLSKNRDGSWIVNHESDKAKQETIKIINKSDVKKQYKDQITVKDRDKVVFG